MTLKQYEYTLIVIETMNPKPSVDCEPDLMVPE